MIRSRDFFKLKVLIFIGYDGRSFTGMQFQRQAKTRAIENVICDAMLELGLLRKQNMEQLKRVHLSRGARTDKRVHALLNAISIKLDISEKFLKQREDGPSDRVSKADDKSRINWQKLIGEMNCNLPKDLRVFAARIVTKGFDIRHDAKHRSYVYLLPAMVFCSKKQLEQQQSPELESSQAQQIIVQLKTLIQLYKGTHCYNNFTKGYKPDDKRCVRYIMDMQVQLVLIDKRLFYRFKLVGQSFIYHQIRKMVGLLVQLFVEDQLEGKQRAVCEKGEALKQALKEFGKRVFLAPGQGLYLEKLGLESYNSRECIPQSLELSQGQQKEVQQFRAQLQHSMVDEQKVFSEWIRSHLLGEEIQQDQDEEMGGGDE